MMDIHGLAYAVAEHPDPSTWKTFGEDVLGMQAGNSPDGVVWLKMDERAYRIAVVKGPKSRYFASGWELPDEKAFTNAIVDLKKAGVEPRHATDAEKKSRNCIDMVWFEDPSGNRHELVLGF